MSINISIIVPVFEQWHLVPELLHSLSVQSCLKEDYEILLVDNGSKNISLPELMPPNVRVLHCDTCGSYAARNHGIRNALGEWLVFTDADCLPTEYWLSEIVKVANANQAADILVAGYVEAVGQTQNPTIYEIYDIVRGIPQAHYVSRGYAATANLAMPRKLVDQLRGFNDQLYSGGDAEFCRRAGAIGYDIIYVPSAVVQHRARTSWEAIATKARRMKGGQLSCKTFRYKAWVVFRTFLSPVISIFRIFCTSKQPLKYRAVATIVYMRVWLVELAELFQVSLGKLPERR